ncbi:MAG TPA: cytochrome d ubiquinol oxidase subunit II [Candidatus Binatia bacterium]|nr:cytochrome d ubiquinol oxidase subunit II [Candidatus Binatia bacterium]
MDLNTLWFVLIAVLYIGFFVLEGFDFGVGILLPLLGVGEQSRRVIVNTIGPHWDANEVWLLTAGGATFAAFPHWYATLFSGLYLPLFLLLLALIVRGVAFEFRSKDENQRWRNIWDACIFLGSLVPTLLLGVAFANLIRGVPIDAEMNYVGGFWNLLNPYALLVGLLAVVGFTFHGAVFLSLKIDGELRRRSVATARRLWPIALLLLILSFVATYLATDAQSQLGVNPGLVPLGAALALLAGGYFISHGHEGWAFGASALAIVFTVMTFFMILFPRVMVSSIDPAYSLTIYNASSSPYTLRIMTFVALIFVPITLIYQGWSYWVFRGRITAKSNLEY